MPAEDPRVEILEKAHGVTLSSEERKRLAAALKVLDTRATELPQPGLRYRHGSPSLR